MEKQRKKQLPSDQLGNLQSLKTSSEAVNCVKRLETMF